MARKKQPQYELPSEGALRTLLKHCKSYGNKISEYTGELREKIARAVDKDHLHKKAFAHARMGDKMEAPELAIYLAHRDHYEEVFGLRERAASAPELGLKEGEAAEDEGEERPRGPRLVGADADVG